MTRNRGQVLMDATDTAIELFFLYGVLVVLSAFAYDIFEGKSFWDSLWWASVTAMTVGYGDVYPVTTGGRVIAIFLMHVVPSKMRSNR